MQSEYYKQTHDRYAPYWAAGLVSLCFCGLATSWFDFGDFWQGYVLDMTGPAWNYILVRLLFRSFVDNRWSRFFTPRKTFILFVTIAFGIEILQYYEVYNATFDPLDFLAYISILLPVYILDSLQQRRWCFPSRIEFDRLNKILNSSCA